MTTINRLARKLQQLICLEGEKSNEEISGFIVGELLGDYEGLYAELLHEDNDIKRIADLASDLEWSNGSPEELVAMWEEMKRLINNL